MVYGVIQNFIQGLKYRGGWRGLLEHMYTVRVVVVVVSGRITMIKQSSVFEFFLNYHKFHHYYFFASNYHNFVEW